MNRPFTPGPWETGAGDCHGIYAETKDGRRKIADFSTNGHHTDSFEDFANSTLAAASPDLLEAAKQALDQLTGANPDEEPLLVVDALRAAIAKAEGKTQ